MKILFVIDTFYTSNNGTSISAQRFAGELRRRGHRVRILCGDKPKTAEDQQLADDDFCTGIFHFPVFQFLCEKHDFFYANADRQLIRQACNWADVVHVYTPFFLSNAVIDYCELTGKPVTAAFHVQPENISSSFGMGKFKPFNDLIYRLFRHFTYNRIRHIHTPSQFIAEELRKHGYLSRMHVISNGIHDEFLQAGELKQSNRRSRSNSDSVLTSNSPTDGLIKIMMIGRLSREKRQDVIIRAMRYSRYADRIQLVFAGRGPEYERYVRMSRDLKHAPRFVYLNREQLISELLTTDLYIHASDMEIEAISCIEAFATGLVPVIANSPVSATPQFALDDRSLFEAGNPQDLARAIDYWIEHPEQKAEMEQRYADAAHRYSLSRSVRLFELMLRQEIVEARNITHNRHETNSPAARATVLPAHKRSAV